MKATKAMKAAAVLAGSLAVAGSAAPAFAAEPAPADPAPAAPRAGLDALISDTLHQATPVGTTMLDAEHNESTVNAVKGVTNGLTYEGGPGKLIGGLPVGK
ncbi:hypothetical protein [Streptomyces sp. DSM 118878]